MTTLSKHIGALTLGLAAASGAMAANPPKAPARPSAEAERIKALEGKLEQSLSVIEALQKRVADLEKSASAKAASPAPAAPPAVATAATESTTTRVESLEQSVRELAAATSSARVADAGVPLHGFLDVGFAHASKARDGEHNGMRLGTFDLYLTPQLGDKVRTLIELAFEYGPDGGLGIDAERLQIGYALSDELVAWAGRFHTPYGYWNTAFHHGAQLQTSITRPRLIAFEDQGGILPSHSVGVWANGKAQNEWGRWGYDVYVSNGNRIADGVLDYNAGGDDNGNKAVGFNLSFSPKQVAGLTVGVHGMRQGVDGTNADQSRSGRTQMQFLGGYAYLDADSYELIGEYYRFSNKDRTTGSTHRSWAGFVQAGVNVADRTTAFARYEKAALSAADPYFTLQESGASYRSIVLGLRYDLDPKAALKFQYDSSRDEGSPLGTINTWRAQYAIRF